MSANPTPQNLFERFQASSAIGGGNASYIDELYETWLADPNAVEPGWRNYFNELQTARESWRSRRETLSPPPLSKQV